MSIGFFYGFVMASKEKSMNKFKWLLYSLILLFCISCSRSHSINLEKVLSIKVVYISETNQVEKKLYSEESAELAFLKLWLKNNTEGWQPFVGTQPGGGVILISGNEFWLNIGEGTAILGYKSGENEYTELIKDISYSDFNALKIKGT